MIQRYFSFILFVVVTTACTDSAPSDSSAANALPEDPKITNIAETPVEKKIKGTATLLSGQIVGMDAGKKLYFDRKTLDATDVKDNVTLDQDSKFELKTGIEAAGIFRLRIGINPIWMLLEGGENVSIQAEMNGNTLKNYELSGAKYAAEMKQWSTNSSKANIVNYLKKSKDSKALLDLFLVLKLDMITNIKLYQKVLETLQETYPDASFTKQFASRVLSTVSKMKNQPLSPGSKAPEIKLPDPDGKKRSLSALRGKVVLLDFWASWCRPCRMSNPHVVEMYNKYNKKGFDVFNVSLDGIDDRKAAMYQNDAATIAQVTALEKEKWRQAIKTDGLIWKNHVSELRSWSSPVAALYKVNSIPKTFLLDKNGVIRYENLRGKALEEAIQVLIKE